MADKETGSLTSASALGGTEQVHILQAGNSRRAAFNGVIKTYFDSLYAAISHTHTVSQLSDATANGRSWLQAANYSAMKALLSLTKSDVGLGNVDNTSDSTKNSAAVTLTNKRITQRIGTITSGTPAPSADSHDQYNVTALATAPTVSAPTGTPTDGQKLIIRIKDNGTARALAWNAIYRAVGVPLPTTTILSKTLYCGFIYNAADTKWDLVAVAQEA